MAVAATATKPTGQVPAAAQPAIPAPEGIRAQKLRESAIKRLATGRMKPIGYYSEPQQIMVPADWDMDDILKPECWAFIAPSLQSNPSASVMHDRLGTILHVHTEDHAFYAILYVHKLQRDAQGQANAAEMTCIGPAVDPETGKACAVDVKTGMPWQGRPRNR